MADGREERKEQEERCKWEEQREREDRLTERHSEETGKPERRES